MAIDFPNAPTTGQVFQGWTYDGEKWLAQGLAIGAVRYDAAQGLSSAQQLQARSNIGVSTNGAFITDRNGVNQTGMTAAADNKIVWTTVQANAEGWFTVGNGRYTPQVAGVYMFVLNVGTSSGTGGDGPQPELWKNGAKAKNGVYAGTGTLTNSAVSAALVMNGSTDYVEAYTYLPAAVTAINGTTTGSNFQGWRIG